MRLKFTLLRRNAGPANIVVTTDATASVGDIAAAIAAADPVEPTAPGPVTLVVSPPAFSTETVLVPGTPIGEAEIGSGFTVRITRPADPSELSRATPGAIARVLAGPDAGREFPLPFGESTIGRDPSCTVVLADPLASKVHAKVIVTDTLEVADLNSANGLLIDGGVVTRVTVDEHQSVVIGDTELGFRRLDRASAPRVAERGGVLPVNRAPRVEQRYPGRSFPSPAAPAAPEKSRFPWISLVAPLVTGAAMFALFQSPFALLFVALAPVLVLGSYLDNGLTRRRRLDQETARFDAELHDLTVQLAEEVPRERAVRSAETPATSEIAADALQLGPLLWTRRAEHWSFLALRLGTGTLTSRNTVEPGPDDPRAVPELRTRARDAVAPFATIADVPLVESAYSAGAIGVAGERAATADYVRGLLVQAAGLHSPAEVAIAALTSASWSPEFAWLGWLPHSSSPQSPLGAQLHLADSAATGQALLASLEDLVAARASTETSRRGAIDEADAVVAEGAKVGLKGATAPPAGRRGPALLLVVTDDAPVDRARLVQLAERAADADVHILWLASTIRDLPAVCRSWVDLSGGSDAATVGLVRLGDAVSPVRTERVDLPQATALARRLAPLVDSGARVADSSDLPPSVSFLALVGGEFGETAASVVDRWQQNDSLHVSATTHAHAAAPPGAPAAPGAPTAAPARPARRASGLRALVGVAGPDSMHLDLRAQGPHALVGGTTGSGKSEFLQAWVLGMALEYSPDRVTFLFVDYKGGSAFAECVALPHSVGLVTDLSPHLVRRALTSLRAELQHRERLLGRKKAKDLLELEKRGDPECPPALVIVIDEFAALATDVPDFVDGVVDVAQRGRSLGIHLIMATQRPAGVIKDNLRANTNLRVALRMADEHDSTDVIGEKSAAAFDPSLPGRAIAKTGPGKVTPFQTAYVGGHTRSEPERAAVKVAELRFGAEIVWEARTGAVAPAVEETGPNDEARIVATIGTAALAAEVRPPRRPWLDELAPVYELRDLVVADRRDLGDEAATGAAGFPLGVSDLPETQEQRTARFLPDVDGHLAVYGTGGSGKTVLLRTLAAAAGLTSGSDPTDVYALDFAGGGLRMLERLPHVGSVIAGDDTERVARLLRTLGELLDRRGRDFAAVDAGSLDDYRRIAGAPGTPRLLLLVDGFPAFRSEWEAGSGRSARYSEFLRLLSEGRRVGVHVAFTADRPGSVPTSVSSSVPRRVVLRLSDDSSYLMLDVPDDVLGQGSPAGRALLDGHETQIAVLGATRNVLEQAAAVERLADELRAAARTSGRAEAAAIRALPTEVPLGDFPEHVASRPVLGISDDTLQPIGFEPSGAMLVAGPPGSGRTSALLTLAQSLRRADPGIRLHYLGHRRSPLGAALDWEGQATEPERVAELARALAAEVTAAPTPAAASGTSTDGSPTDGSSNPGSSNDGSPTDGTAPARRIAVLVEGIGDFLSTPADAPIVELIRAIKRSDHLLIAEAESSAWISSWPLLAEIKNTRRGILLQPEPAEGESILRTVLPRVARSEFPPGRGYYVAGKAVRVHLPLPAATTASPTAPSTA
ncbi:FtsK/SpoIIIE domain-containing protein [Herbiconiux sp. KACC 21604]|uniref:FtsK/SpoIIIE domain-containing protein n=1 Tax=unclassified Herbiconiux TaxID=2618217 RepID=UPI001492967C|nr:FtsK/SpoIIIE domain-containing protein [Herbiconiux sp. SALV-R1]QJU54262.1 FHA domain-containing protein [Herbiconiux sp. SALV-R1]WPO85329.1 FtsK/SpoIIIE domain-containing protein [Herbiconiux sp. KACC 21604]